MSASNQHMQREAILERIGAEYPEYANALRDEFRRVEEQLEAAHAENYRLAKWQESRIQDATGAAWEAVELVRRLRNVGFSGLVSAYWNEEADRILAAVPNPAKRPT